MRSAEKCLAIIRTRGERRLPIDDLYRQLFNPEFYLHAYGKIYRNDGAMTPGTTSETVDGMSPTKIQTIIDALRFERYHWSPVRRTYIPKKAGKLSPLGLPTWSDKLLQEVVRQAALGESPFPRSDTRGLHATGRSTARPAAITKTGVDHHGGSLHDRANCRTTPLRLRRGTPRVQFSVQLSVEQY